MDQLFLPATEANTGEKIRSNGFQKSGIQGFTGNNREFSRIITALSNIRGLAFRAGNFPNWSREIPQALTIRPS
jgi:hypothetical protein